MDAGWQNELYFGDNLDILREQIAAESVDLIYLDPPFNSNATYNVLFRLPISHLVSCIFDRAWGLLSSEHVLTGC